MSGNVLSEPFPKSTLLVGGVLWAIVFPLIAWVLGSSIANGKQLERILERLDGQAQFNAAIMRTTAKLQSDTAELKSDVALLKYQLERGK